MVSAHVCGILATRARQVFFDGTDGSEGRWGVSTVKRMSKTYQFYEINEKGGGFSS